MRTTSHSQIEPQRRDEPARELPEGESMTHRQRARTDEALPAGPQRQPFHRAAGGVRAIENPYRLAQPRGLLEHVAQRRSEGIDATAEILQVDQQHVERVHHRRGRAAHRAVETEHRDVVHRVDVVGRLDHVVLLVAAQPVLRPESCRQPHVAERRQRIERMREIARDGRRMREQRDAPPGEWLAQPGLFDEPLETDLHALRSSTAKPSG